MPRPAALTQIPPYLSHLEMVRGSLEEFFRSLSDADKLAFLNAIRSGALFNFTTTS
jgi:hypothetical protein